jgi:hypothetical protein
MVSSLFRTFICTLLAASLFSAASPMPQPAAYTFTHEVERAIDAKADSGANMLRELRDINHIFATSSAVMALFAAFLSENKTLSVLALVVCVYNMVQANRKQRAINDIESIKQLVRGNIYVRPH